MAKKVDTTPAVARTHPPLVHFISNDANRAWLAALLTDPRFLAVNHYVCEQNAVNPGDVVGAKCLVAEELVRQTAMHVGTKNYLQTLKKILFESQPKDQLPESWEHIHPPLE